MNKLDLKFYERRLAEERARAMNAVTPESRRAHQLLAESYEQQIASETAKAVPRPLGARFSKLHG